MEPTKPPFADETLFGGPPFGFHVNLKGSIPDRVYVGPQIG